MVVNAVREHGLQQARGKAELYKITLLKMRTVPTID
jgi:hypothetical protein